MIFLKILKKYLKYLKFIFQLFQKQCISLSLIKLFLEYSFILFLEQQVNRFNLNIIIKKLAIINLLKFLKCFQDLKIYLNITK